MANEYSVQYIRPPFRGIDFSKDGGLIEDGFLAHGTYNIVPDTRYFGGLKKRFGVAPYDSGATCDDYIRTIYRLTTGSGPLVYVDHLSDASILIKSSDGTTLSTQAAAWPIITSCWRSFGGYDLYVNGNVYLKTDDGGSTWSAISNITAGTAAIEPYNNYLFAAAIGGSSGLATKTVQWSDVSDPETWPATNELTFTTSKPFDSIYGLKEHDGYMFVFFYHQIIVMQGYGPTFDVVGKNSTSGCYANESICSTPFGLYWWSPEQGLCCFRDGYQTVDNILKRKYPDFSGGTGQVWSGVWLPSEQCLRYYTWDTGSQGYRFDYYPLTDALYYCTGSGCAMSAAFYDSNVYNAARLYLGGNMYSHQYLMTEVDDASQSTYYASSANYYSDNATAVTGVLLTKANDHGHPEMIKTVRNVYPRIYEVAIYDDADSGDIKYGYSPDRKNDGVNTYLAAYSILPSSTDLIHETRIGVNSTCSTMQHSIVDNLKGGRVSYIGLTESGRLDQVL